MAGHAIRRRLGIGLLLASAMTGLISSGATGASRAVRTPFDPSSIALGLQSVGSGFANPVQVTNAGDGSNRLFVIEQRGYVRNLAAGPSGTPFLDIQTRVVFGGERGLLGLAFHPAFETNRKFYVNYTRAADGATIVDEYRVTTNPNVVSTATRRQIIAIGQPYANHNGGGLAFGPDGYLYIGMGDGGDGGDPEERAQNVNSLLGKILRIDVNGTSTGRQYRIPPTNPYVGRTGLDEIWSIGLRNPWRWSFDRLTGDLWIGDVGQGSWEEVDRSTAATGGGRGLNYGWDVMEGRHCFEPMSGCSTSGKVMPLAEYAHDVAGDNNCSITGGFVYRGARYPRLRGGYFYADYCSGRIWTVGSTAGEPATGTELLNTTINITSFGESEAGELYVVGHGGTIHRVIELGRNPIVVGR